MPTDKNAQGNRGESIFQVIISTPHNGLPLFRADFLGEKWPIADCVVELADLPGRFFLVQVKSTSLGMNGKGRLRAEVPKGRFNSLAAVPLPTYVVGIDDPNECAYLSAAVSPRSTKLSSFSTAFPLRDAQVRSALHDEVRDYWNSVSTNVTWVESAFQE